VDGEIHPALFQFQRDVTRWALRRGRAAIFADCGMGKTLMQLVWADHVRQETGGRVLILAPLAVAQQTEREAARFGLTATFARADTGAPITVANYEMLHHFDPGAFAGVVLDESSILKAYDGKTRTQLVQSFASTPYRLACTATPAPNDHMELGNHAQFLGVMTREEMLAMFFCHDGGDTSQWRVKGHGVKAFWSWVASWAVMVRKPSDLGYDDAGFALPPMWTHESIVPMGQEYAQAAGMLFASEARTLGDQRAARRASMTRRVEVIANMVNGSREPWVIWCELNDEADACEKAIPDAVQVAGADTVEDKESRLTAFAAGRARVLVTKPSIAGFGLNWQHCAHVAFCGLGHSYESYYQAVRRCWRFGQTRPVAVHVVISDAESAVLENVQRKEHDAEEMASQMVALMSETMNANVHGATREKAAHTTDVRTEARWSLHLGDCVDVVRALPEASIDYTIFSPPFASLYTYSNSDRDMGNCATREAFAEHFGYLVPELLRVTKPGRLLSFHCMQLPSSKTRDGVIGLTDFRGELIRTFVAAGWIYHSEVCIWKDPVTAMQRTKALGLLYKQIKKNAAMSRQGIADYLVTMRKPGENPEPVTHTPADLPLSLWQRVASPVWMDIDPSDTLSYTEARVDDDERHICPLQLGVIERAVRLWTNPGDLVLSPFAGIGSEGHVALQEGRRFVGAELKPSYWKQACLNLHAAAQEKQIDLFSAVAP
jgi:superfamily II DNA or RNA helicase